MFTGIVRELGRVSALSAAGAGIRLTVEAPATAATAAVGDSIAINGCCLTAVAVAGTALSFDAVPETIARTSIAALAPGRLVNIEPALRAGEPLGGHYVQGHVDGVGSVRAVAAEGNGRRVSVEAPSALRRYLVEKGSVTVEGVSLTVASLEPEGFAVALVPHTLAATTLAALAPGAPVNIEVDVLAKYVERLLERSSL